MHVLYLALSPTWQVISLAERDTSYCLSFLLLFFLILLLLHPSLLKRIIYNSVITLFHLPSISSIWVKTPPICRVNCFQLFCLITSACTYLIMWKYYTSESNSCSHFLWFPRKRICFSKHCGCYATDFWCKYFPEILSSAWLSGTE